MAETRVVNILLCQVILNLLPGGGWQPQPCSGTLSCSALPSFCINHRRNSYQLMQFSTLILITEVPCCRTPPPPPPPPLSVPPRAGPCPAPLGTVCAWPSAGGCTTTPSQWHAWWPGSCNCVHHTLNPPLVLLPFVTKMGSWSHSGPLDRWMHFTLYGHIGQLEGGWGVSWAIPDHPGPASVFARSARGFIN